MIENNPILAIIIDLYHRAEAGDFQAIMILVVGALMLFAPLIDKVRDKIEDYFALSQIKEQKKSKMKTCPHCGKKVNEIASTCLSCGESFKK